LVGFFSYWCIDENDRQDINFGGIRLFSWLLPIFFDLARLINPIAAKVEDTADPRHQGRSCSRLPQGLDNAGDVMSSAFLKGKRHSKIKCFHWMPPTVRSYNGYYNQRKAFV